MARPESGHLHHVTARAGEPPLRATHGLGEAGRARRENWQEQVLLGHWALRIGGWLPGEIVAVLCAVDQHHPVIGYFGVHPVKQGPGFAVGHHHLAVGVTDEKPQLVPSIGRVDADDHGAGKGRSP